MKQSMIITPNFHFNGECEQALKLYKICIIS